MKPIHAIITLLFLPLAVGHTVFRTSLAQLDGRTRLTGLSRPVSIERDALGIPTITAESRADLAFATGFVHAQDRFFQMDLARRYASGDLRGLFGKVAKPRDALARKFQFRRVARAAVALLEPADRKVLEAYTNGVNEGLASLHGRPWEYWLLQHVPIEWHPEDTMLVIYAMWWDLQYGERKRAELRLDINDRLPGTPESDGWKPAMRFLFPARTRWDAPVDAATAGASESSATARVPIPDATQIDVRRKRGERGVDEVAPGAQAAPPPPPPEVPGSNNWALSGAHTRSGAALLAGDMHLQLRVPTIWYRVRLRLGALDLNGITLPGGPPLVAGSNGSIAWSFTNSYGHWLDVDPKTRAVHWLATDPAATNLRLLALETAKSTAGALALAPQIGIPHQNLIVADRAGHIGWSIAGRIPRDAGWMQESRYSQWLSAGETPAIVDPAGGMLWSANARVTNDAKSEALLGGRAATIGAGYDLGARAAQIREDLKTVPRAATPKDMLDIQLDDRAVLMSEWRERLLRALDSQALEHHPDRAELRELAEHWDGRAATASVGYRVVATFANQTRELVWQSILRSLGVASADAAEAAFEEPLARLLDEEPANFLPAQFSDWKSLLVAQADATIAQLHRQCAQLRECTWGQVNTVRIRHPMSASLPWLSRFIDMPVVELAGDRDMPRVQGTDFGASERLAVSPGEEAQGILTIAGGQSAHPLSPYYRAGFDAWSKGLPLPLLPGPTEHRLELTP